MSRIGLLVLCLRVLSFRASVRIAMMNEHGNSDTASNVHLVLRWQHAFNSLSTYVEFRTNEVCCILLGADSHD